MEEELHIPTRGDNSNNWRTPWNEMQTFNGDISVNQSSFRSQSPSKMAGFRTFSPTKMTGDHMNKQNDPMTENLLNTNLEETQKDTKIQGKFPTHV